MIGFTAGITYVFASKLMANVFKVDDPLDAVAVHGFCGVWGVLCASIFAHQPNYAAAYTDELSQDDSQGWIYGGNGKLFGCACVFILAIIAWVLGHMIPFFFVMRMLGLLRVDEAEERAGLDVSHHGGGAYETPATTELAGKGGKDYGSGMGGGNGEHDALLSRCACLNMIVGSLQWGVQPVSSTVLRHTVRHCHAASTCHKYRRMSLHTFNRFAQWLVVV